ncbi:MAG: alpha-N-arabinofuranosidase [Puniceicoccaceae bacterium]|nr:MAG: alpha-N-arabinofuranosidase [Puniceicoccaceae bacterium]
MKASLILDPDFQVSDVDPRLFGGFAEHLGRHIYEGIYEPGHPTADANGFRRDVLDLVRELRMPVMRYPGGNFVSGYNWEDGVGPVDQRPRKLDLAWKTTEPNTFGTNEFINWCRKVGTAPMLAVNLGTRGPAEARDLVEYCNHPGGTALSDLRKQHGFAKPHAVKLWCLGNEMDGPWQTGAKTATEYGRIAAEAAKVMRWVDPSIELVACGSSSRGMATFGKWELEVLDHAFDHVDYLSLHTYYSNADNDTPSFLARPEAMGEFIEETAALCDAVAASKKSRKRIHLSFDEWNVWFHSHGDREKRRIKDWDEAPPLLEDIYTMEDALVVGGMLIALLNYADRVKIGCIAQVVNVIAPIMTAKGGPAWRQTIFYPFLHASHHGRGKVLRPVVVSPTYDCKEREQTPFLTSSSVLNDDGGLTVFAVNRSLDEPLDLNLDLRSFPTLAPAEHLILDHADLKASNTEKKPETVKPRLARNLPKPVERGFRARLPKASWNVLRFARTARK